MLHYKILEKLGASKAEAVDNRKTNFTLPSAARARSWRHGRGHKAGDAKLKRDVAIKFLPRQIAASAEERERFKIEAQAAAALELKNLAKVSNLRKVMDIDSCFRL